MSKKIQTQEDSLFFDQMQITNPQISASQVATNQNIYTVGQLSGVIQDSLESNFANIKVKGEICSLTKHSSGHYYFSLKDNDGFINVIVWKTSLARIKASIENGLEVIASGKVSSYPKSSKYNIIAHHIEASGIGEMIKLLEARRKKLEALGIFDKSIKIPIVKYPKVIGIITSPTGAVIEDMLNRINQRFAAVKVIVHPAIMQGPASPESVIKALNFFAKQITNGSQNAPQTIIIARGGGSFEDLFTFNDEELVVTTAKFASLNCGVISAIGHGTDFTLLDLAASLHAVTPTAAAEAATPDSANIRQSIERFNSKSLFCATNAIKQKTERLKTIYNSIEKTFYYKNKELQNQINQRFTIIAKSIKEQINAYRLKLLVLKITNSKINDLELKLELYYQVTYRVLTAKLNFMIKNFSIQKHHQFAKTQSLLKSLQSNLDKLCEKIELTNKRLQLHMVISDSKGYLITSINQVKTGDNVVISLKDGKFTSSVREIVKK
jgi:exodeoxyribonuclease VII large subunit